jgi:AbrB family looped-hinge helix DNA binding protein
MLTATITSKGQITLPKAVRQSLRLHSGDKIAFIINEKEEAVIRPITRSAEHVFGLLHKNNQKMVSIQEMDQAIRTKMRDIKP